jgi:hypothetical protein
MIAVAVLVSAADPQAADRHERHPNHDLQPPWK